MSFTSLIGTSMRVLWPLYAAVFTVFLLISISNLAFMPRIKPGAPTKGKKLSILVPARNEEINIERCVRSLLKQDYEDYELIVLNDNSTDKTGEILARISAEDKRLKVIQGTPLPDGWLGMCWACMNLARASVGDILMFVDSDTWHEPYCASSTVDIFRKTGASLVSGITKQHMGTFGEVITVSLMPFGMLSLFPVIMMNQLNLKFPAIAAGQYMCFRREDYFAVGGHEAVKSHATLDMELAKIMKKRLLRVVMADATNAVNARMYHSFKEAFLGFTKNVFGSFNFRVLPFVAVFVVVYTAMMSPIFYLLLHGFSKDAFLSVISLLLIGMCLLLWILFCIMGKLPLYLVLIYPLNFGMWFIMAMNSMIQTIFGRSTWKGRKMPRPKVRLF